MSGRPLTANATNKIVRSTMGLPPNIINDKIPLIKPAVQQNILHRYALQQTSSTSIMSFSNSLYGKRYSANRTANNTPYVHCTNAQMIP